MKKFQRRMTIIFLAITLLAGSTLNSFAAVPIAESAFELEQTNAGDLYYAGLRQMLNSIPLNPMQSTGDPTLDQLLDSIFARIITPEMDTHDKLKACYDYLIENTQYSSAPNSLNSHNGTNWTWFFSYLDVYDATYEVLTTGYGVCDHYASAFAVMARKIGVPMYRVNGETHTASGGFTGHAWCELQHNGVIYVFDPQVEDNIAGRNGGAIRYLRFGGTETQLADKYIRGHITEDFSEQGTVRTRPTTFQYNTVFQAPDTTLYRDNQHRCDFVLELASASQTCHFDAGSISGTITPMIEGCDYSDDVVLELYIALKDGRQMLPQYIIQIGPTRYTLTYTAQLDETALTNEKYIPMDVKAIRLLQDLAASREQPVTVSFRVLNALGSYEDVSFTMSDSMKDGLIHMYNLFANAGGLNQQFYRDYIYLTLDIGK